MFFQFLELAYAALGLLHWQFPLPLRLGAQIFPWLAPFSYSDFSSNISSSDSLWPLQRKKSYLHHSLSLPYFLLYYLQSTCHYLKLEYVFIGYMFIISLSPNWNINTFKAEALICLFHLSIPLYSLNKYLDYIWPYLFNLVGSINIRSIRHLKFKYM